MRLTWCIPFLLLLCYHHLMAAERPQTPGNQPIEQAIEHLQLEAAAQLNAQIQDVKLRLYYQSRLLFIPYLVSEPAGQYDRFIEFSKLAATQLDKLPDADADKKWMMAEIFFMRGVLRALNQQNVTSAIDMKSACSLILESRNSHPKSFENRKLLGVFQVAMAAMPKKLQWIGKVLCLGGDLVSGLNNLELAAQNGKMLPRESQTLLFYFEKNLLERPESAHHRARLLHEKHPQSKIFSYLLLTSLIELRQIDDAIRFAESQEATATQKAGQMPLPIWNYTLGKAYFFRLDYALAIGQFDRFLNTYKGKNLKADALYRKGMAYLLQGKSRQARETLTAFANLPKSEFDADEYARQQSLNYLLAAPTPTDKCLYAARNLFDGGYYIRALDSINSIDVTFPNLSTAQKTEYHYRLGRIHDAMGKKDAAKESYQQCISYSVSSAQWMRVYALYYLGRIEAEQGNTERARIFYKTALTFDHYPYQSGLEQRAKSALESLKLAK